jgi:N-formylmaleamate deformylase
MSGPDVWDATVAHLQGRYELHVVHLAGFAGAPASPGPDFLGRVRTALLAYVAGLPRREAQRPVIVGHSLGGFLAYALASAAPDAFDGVVTVDGVPFLAALRDANVTADAVRPSAAGMQAMFTSMTGAQLAAQTRMGLPTMMRDTTNAQRATEWARTSTPTMVGQAMAEMLTTDLRPVVSAIRAPVLLIAAGGAAPTPDARATIRAQYAAQIAGVPRHDVLVAERAYHFIMLDDPAFFHSTLDAFLAKVDARTGARSDR